MDLPRGEDCSLLAGETRGAEEITPRLRVWASLGSAAERFHYSFNRIGSAASLQPSAPNIPSMTTRPIKDVLLIGFGAVGAVCM